MRNLSDAWADLRESFGADWDGPNEVKHAHHRSMILMALGDPTQASSSSHSSQLVDKGNQRYVRGCLHPWDAVLYDLVCKHDYDVRAMLREAQGADWQP